MKTRLALVAGLAISITSLAGAQATAPAQKPADPKPAATQPGTKKVVKSADDLPRHTYRIEGKASEFVLSGEPFKVFVAKLKTDTQSDLAQYDIQDRTTLQGYHSLLAQIAFFERNFDEALAQSDQAKALEAKESKKLMLGQTLRAIAATEKAGGDEAARSAAFRAELKKNVSTLPWDVVREEVTSAKGRSEMVTRDLVIGSLQGQLDPVVAQQNGELSGDLARQLVAARNAVDLILPRNKDVAAVYGEIIAANATEKKDIWSSRLVTLTDKDGGTPVVVGIWDSGVDVKPFGKNVYVNAKESVNGKDDDANGFIDDVNGIAFDLENKPTTDLLLATKDLKSPIDLVQAHTKGLGDIQANVDSPEAKALREYVKTLKPESVTPFLEDVGLYGGYSHGTHVAGIAAEGNPSVRVLAARLSFDHREIPLNAPSEELSRASAKMYMDTVGYFKKTGVRVVNMSWGGSKKDIERSLEIKGVGKDSAERAEIARKLFAIERDGLEAAMKSAPEILFVAAAGNSDNDNTFAEMIPSGLSLPNMITVGAVDQSGTPTGFTTFGKSVKLYSNGFEVESYVPGGKRMKYSGTSMAAPNVTNLAAKLIALKPSLTVQETIDAITKGATPMEGQPGLLVINPKASVALVK